jgi:SAM-dependent methyltransferase
MDRQTLSALAHADHPIAAPLSEASVAEVLDRALRPDAHVLDLGCGEGAWLLRALEVRPDVTAVGVDLSDKGFGRTRAAAARAGAADRLDLLVADATEYRGDRPADVVLSVGAAHAFGGLLPTLAAARTHLAPNGTVVIGDGFWEREPGADLRAEIEAPDQPYADLAGTIAAVAADGWTPVYGHVSTIEEWDDYEFSWTGSLARWALDHPDDPDAKQALEASAEHRDMWLGYRGVLGFVTLVLRRTG